jgi:hypothetical protein
MKKVEGGVGKVLLLMHFKVQMLIAKKGEGGRNLLI